MSDKPTLRDGQIARRLRAYALAAGATVATTASTTADPIVFDGIEYFDFHIAIDINNGLTGDFIEGNAFPDRDFNLFSYDESYTDMRIYGAISGNDVVAAQVPLPHSSFYRGAIPYQTGDTLGPGLPFHPYALIGRASQNSFFPWQPGQRGFLGLRFRIDGSNHYGWAEITFHGSRATLHAMGYESQADTPIRIDRDPCAGDVNNDQTVDLADLAVVLAQFGMSGGNLSGDLNVDQTVDLGDLAIVLAAFGTSCP